jgi:hypothetical protein
VAIAKDIYAMSNEANIPAEEPVFDVKKAMAELTADQPDFAARKLSFEEKCGAFAALYGGARHSVVARAFGVTPTTVSLLAGCLPYDPDPGRRAYDPETKTYIGGYQGLSRNRIEGRKQHYQDVAKEFIALGEHAFNERYYRPFHDRLWKARNEVTAKHVTAKPRLAGPNPAADKYSFRITHKTINMHGEHWRVSWLGHKTDPAQAGWKISPCQENGERLEAGWSWRGDDMNADMPFRTSGEAFDGVYAFYGEESPRPKPGRPRR